jgi:hypothetical protein
LTGVPEGAARAAEPRPKATMADKAKAERREIDVKNVMVYSRCNQPTS